MLKVTQMPDGLGNWMPGALQQSDTIYAVVLVAGTSQQIPLPAGANAIVFAASGGSDFYMLLANSVIAVPVANNVAGTAPELNPLVRSCTGKTYVSLISPVSCVITMAFYS